MVHIIILAALLVASVGQAHDLWVVPGKFMPSPGERIRIFINSGDEFPQSASLVGEHRVESFSLITAKGQKPLSGLMADGKSLTVEFSAPDAGTVLLVLATKSRLVRLNADDFNAYLEEDGLPQILALREERDELTQPVVERYAKWAKAVLQVGDEADETWKEPVGHRIEIVPEEDCYSVQPGEELGLKVLFEGEPLSGVTVTGTRAGGPRHEVGAVTDAEGRVRLPITRAGRWYLHCIHMIRPAEDDSQIQWESFWATLTFEVRR
jgi:uncharacterized GH25 family protein